MAPPFIYPRHDLVVSTADVMLRDILHLPRTLRRSPVSAGAAILTLSLTLGTAASIFAVVDAVLLRPPDFDDPESLVSLGAKPVDEIAAGSQRVTYGTFEAWRERAASLARLEALDGTNLTLTDLGPAERVMATDVTPGLMTLLGLVPTRGRLFDPGEIGQPVIIISETFWHGKLADDPAVIGRQITLGGQAYTIVGVVPDRYSVALNPCDVWRPLPFASAEAARTGYVVRVIARLAAKASPADLERALDEISRASSPPMRVVATPLIVATAGDAAPTLILLATAAVLATLVAFISLAGLLIVRSISRRREFAVRRALGAGLSEVARQWLLEAGALIIIGTLGGVLLASWLTPIVGRLALEPFHGIANREVVVSWRVVGALAIVAFACGGICGLLPGVAAARSSVVDGLRSGASASPRDLRVRRVFVIGEVALAFVLLISMTLLGQTLLNVLRVQPGFDARGVLTLKLSLPSANYSDGARVASFYAALQRALDERFGVGAVSVVDELPLTGDRRRIRVSARGAEAKQEAVTFTASAGYFQVMRIPLIAGRWFDATDNAAAPRRIAISDSLAKRLFAPGQAIGSHVRLGTAARMAEVIGVVGDVKHRALDEPAVPTIYQSALQDPSPSSIVVVRSARPDADVISAVRDEVARLDGKLPVYGIQPMPALVARSPGIPERRLLVAMFTGFGLLALVLSTIGLFGIAAHDVACRRAELALRLALGAEPMRLLRTTLAQGALTVGYGLAVGGVVSTWVVRGLSGVLFTTTQSDVLSFGAVAAVLVATGVGAVLPAALRAAHTDPLAALRSE